MLRAVGASASNAGSALGQCTNEIRRGHVDVAKALLSLAFHRDVGLYRRRVHHELSGLA